MVKNKKVLMQIKQKYFNIVNMGLREMRAWKRNKCSFKASLNRVPINRTIILLSKKDWDTRHIKWAIKSISFIKRMKKIRAGKPVSKDCNLSKKTIALMNWGFNPNKK